MKTMPSCLATISRLNQPPQATPWSALCEYLWQRWWPAWTWRGIGISSGTEVNDPGRKPRDLPEAGELRAWINEPAVAESDVGVIMHECEGKKSIWIWILLAISPLLIYWLSIGPFLRWEQSARTQKQYLARKRLEQKVYAPVIWLEKLDRSHTLAGLDYLSIQPWVNTRFDYTRLPAK